MSDIEVNTEQPVLKKRGRKPKIFLNNKPIDPKYYVDYYHQVIKQKEHVCPRCGKHLACQSSVNRHLNDRKKSCLAKVEANSPSEESDKTKPEKEEEGWYDVAHVLFKLVVRRVKAADPENNV